MKHISRLRSRDSIITALIAVALYSCALTPKLNVTDVNSKTAPAVAALSFDQHHGQIVHWGGRIVDIRNEKEKTVMEIVSYPLRANGNPIESRETMGRFMLESPGYLEPVEYAPGRYITAVGEITRTTQSRVGKAVYTLPVIQVRQLHLWPQQRRSSDFLPHISIGVGFGF